MLRSAVSKVMWLGRATVFAVGLAVILALLFVAASTVLGAGGEPSITGESGQINGISQVVGSEAGAERVLDLEPLASRRTPTQGYAQVLPSCTSDPTPVCTFEDSKAAKGVTRTTPSASISVTNLY